ncbi:hypothetical protein H0W32_03370 [Patescibacteria group bacterium]|nr:hypothetical protein [Patescibacteria group bacterium]
MDLEILELKHRLSLMQRHQKLQAKMQLLLYKQIALQMKIHKRDSEYQIAELKRLLNERSKQKYALPINLSVDSSDSCDISGLSDLDLYDLSVSEEEI